MIELVYSQQKYTKYCVCAENSLPYIYSIFPPLTFNNIIFCYTYAIHIIYTVPTLSQKTRSLVVIRVPPQVDQ